MFSGVVVYLSCISLLLVLSAFFTVDVAFLLMTTWQPCCAGRLTILACSNARHKFCHVQLKVLAILHSPRGIIRIQKHFEETNFKKFSRCQQQIWQEVFWLRSISGQNAIISRDQLASLLWKGKFFKTNSPRTESIVHAGRLSRQHGQVFGMWTKFCGKFIAGEFLEKNASKTYGQRQTL